MFRKDEKTIFLGIETSRLFKVLVKLNILFKKNFFEDRKLIKMTHTKARIVNTDKFRRQKTNG